MTPWANLASVYQSTDRWADAERTWRLALALHPEDPSALSGLAQALTLRGERVEAVAILQRAEKVAPRSVDDWRALGAAYFNLNQWRLAAEKLERATRLDASQVTDWIHLGNAYFALRQRDAAREAFARAESIERDHPALLNALARLHGDAGNFELALKYSDRGTQLRPADAMLWNAKGYSLIRLGRFKEAVAALDTAAALQPEAPAVWINLGQAHFRLRAFPEAARALQQAVRLAPMAADARIYLARTLASTQQWQAAEANLDYLLERAPNTAEAWYVLGLIGHARGAVKDYQLAYDELRDFAPTVAAALKRRTSAKPPADPADLFQ
jgi:tetratricopeptide (TPR) repeat protein